MVSRGRRTAPKKQTIKEVNPRLPDLRKRVAKSPTGPGIYRWLDEKGTVLYVGKAKNLRKRLASYVRAAPRGRSSAALRASSAALRGPWQESFLRIIADFDVTVVGTELEALLLETNLIKQLRPKYNVLMKDDKNYLFIKVRVRDPYPAVEAIRRFSQDGSKYFGPYLNSERVYQTLDFLHEALGYRACRQSLDVLNKKPGSIGSLKECLEHQIGRCNGLCAGEIDASEYLQRIENVIEFLKGHDEKVKGILKEKMENAARDRKFELAAKLRNYIQIVEGKTDRQIVTDGSGEESDIVGVAVLSGRAHVVILHRRDGRLIGESHFALVGRAEDAVSVLEQFLPQFYDDGREIPSTILLPEAMNDGGAMRELLKERRNGPVELMVPSRGRKSHLLQLAERNAREKAKQMELKWEAEERNAKNALDQLQEILGLAEPPRRIEGYDISHLGGTETVGSMVVMKDGKAASDQYRSFTIRSLKRGDVDDYRSIKEVLTRRLRRLTEDLPAEEKRWKADGVTFGKAVKKEQKTIEEIFDSHANEFRTRDIRYADFIVARQKEKIVGFSRLYVHKGGLTEVKSVWVSSEFRGHKLGQFLIRKLLRGVKKGKVYVTNPPELEEYYASMGFRYVMTPPAALQKIMDKRKKKHGDLPGIVMMWEAHQNKVDPSLTATPDLIVIDGGKGQLSTAVSVLKSFGVNIPVIGLAKREEEIFMPGNAHPTICPSDSPGKFLLMRLRDEAHRFSNAHREKRAKTTMKASALDEIPGIGEETKKKLLQKFGALSSVRVASDEALTKILSTAQIAALKEYWNNGVRE